MNAGIMKGRILYRLRSAKISAAWPLERIFTSSSVRREEEIRESSGAYFLSATRSLKRNEKPVMTAYFTARIIRTGSSVKDSSRGSRC